MRRLALILAVLILISGDTRAQNQLTDAVPTLPPFSDWLVALRQEARDKGFSDALLSETDRRRS